jgi:hypothetical protein
MRSGQDNHQPDYCIRRKAIWISSFWWNSVLLRRVMLEIFISQELLAVLGCGGIVLSFGLFVLAIS